MEVNREKFLQTLLAVKPGLAAKEIMPQSTSFIIKDGRIRTYNDEISVSYPFKSDFKAAVPAEKLISYVTKSKSETLTLELDDSELMISGGRSSAGIPVDPKIRLDISEIGEPEKWHPVPENLIKALDFCSFSASSDMTQQILTCINVKGSYAESADDNRMTRYKLSSKMPDPILIPAATVPNLAKFEITSYGLSKGWIHFKTKENVIYSCHNYSAKYPDLSEIVKVEGTSITIPKRLKTMIERARIFSASEFIQDEKITMLIEEGMISVEGRGEEGWCREQAKIEYSGKPISFQVHPEFLMDMLELLNEVIIGDPDDICGKIKMEGADFIHIVSMASPEVVEKPKSRKKAAKESKEDGE